VRIYVAAEAVDLHRGFDGLAAATRGVIAADPLSGHVFVFFNARKNRVKLLVWDHAGYVLLYNERSSHYTSCASIEASWALSSWTLAARATSRSQRLQCLVGTVAPGSS
jgi:transposase